MDDKFWLDYVEHLKEKYKDLSEEEFNNKLFPNPFEGIEVTYIIPVPYSRATIRITSVDFSTQTGTFEFFQTYKDANEANHALSLKQFPEWHTEHCPHCAKLRENNF